MSDASLTGRRILVVEDEYFIASDLKRALEREGADAIGPTGNLAAGMDLAEAEALDAALLDVNLEGARSFPIADRLARRGIPYAFLTGYDDWALPEDYRDAPRIAKPFRFHEVVRTLQALFVQAAGA